MLIRNDYLTIIDEIRNLDKRSLDDYIDKKLIPLKNENQFFIETLYKDIWYIIKDIGEEGEGDLVVENGDFVIEDDDFKISGYQTRLHDIMNWLYTEIVQTTLSVDNIDNDSIDKFMENMEKFENNFLEKKNYTVEYRERLDEIKRSIVEERDFNYESNRHRPVRIFKRIFNWKNFGNGILKLFGVEINVKRIVKNVREK